MAVECRAAVAAELPGSYWIQNSGGQLLQSSGGCVE